MAEGAFTPETFIERWGIAEASERANAQLFLTELADLLAVPRLANSHASGYSFEFPVKIPTGPGESTDGRIDLYRRGSFVLEAKQFVAPKPEQTDLQLAEMQTGTDYSVILNKKLLRFNGGLFEDASVLALDGTQLGILIKASAMQWKDVEPAEEAEGNREVGGRASILRHPARARARSRGAPPARHGSRSLDLCEATC